jgi:UDP-glucose 4-epimerase
LSEKICNYYNLTTKINCINVRLSNSYGSPVFQENNCWELVINDLCKTAFNEKRIKLLSDGSPQRDFIHSSDIYRAIEILVNTKEKNLKNNTYNISSGKTFTILELAHLVKSVYQERYYDSIQIIKQDGSISRNADEFFKTEKYIVNSSKLKLLGFMPKTDLLTGINEIFEYLKKLHDTKN